MNSIRSLNFHGMSIADATMPGFCKNKITPHIKILDLSNNFISCTGASTLANTLMYNTTLKEIDLKYNKIGDVGAVALAEALKNSRLESLCLNNNKISDVGAVSLAEALRTNETLRYLYLSDNPIGSVGVTALVEAIKANKNDIFLALNYIDESGSSALKDLKKELDFKTKDRIIG